MLTRISNEVNQLDPHSDQDDQEIKSSTTDDTRPGFPKRGESQVVDWGPGSCRHLYCAKHCSDNDANTSTSRNCSWTITEACIQFDKWRKMPDNAAQYCPSVSTISIIEPEDEGTLPYALKRIQRDFPKDWKHHPLGSSHDRIDWHQHSLRLYCKSFRDKRETSVTSSLPEGVRSMFKGAMTSIQGEQAPHKKVQCGDQPRRIQVRPSQGLPKYSNTPQLRGSDPYGNYTLAPPLDDSDGPPPDDSDGEEEYRRRHDYAGSSGAARRVMKFFREKEKDRRSSYRGSLA